MPTPDPSSAAGPARADRLGPEPREDDATRLATLDAWLGVPLGGRASSTSSATVTVHTRATDAFASFEAAVAACAGPDSLVVIAGWSFSASTRVTEATTVGMALRAAAARGVQVRALFTRFPAVKIGPLPGIRVRRGNRAATAFVDALPGGAAIHDGWLLHRDLAVAGGRLVNPMQTGVHHQKVWIVHNGSALRAWCGGVDFHPNRTDHPGPAMHDVQAELTGPGAADLYALLQERWNTHPQRPRGITIPPLAADPSGAADTPRRPHRTRILTTYADPTAYAGLGGPPYPFAPTGSTALRDFLHQAIDRAQRFVYLEDQYLVDEEIARHLAAAMPRLDALIAVISRSDEVSRELFQVWDRRRRFLAHLAPHASKVAVVTSRQYVHAKTWVFDDEIALVSSANVNRRSMTHDSEAGVAFGDLTGPGEVRRMRERLWARHLGAAAPPVSAPPELSLELWKSPPAGSPVEAYDANAGADTAPVDPRIARLFTPSTFWDQVVDPGL
jgi:phosphatidylserine/phosphatidylglycerophosphate/cardiolipin synthase-like enzyme